MKIVRAQLLHNFCAKNGARAQFLHNFSESPGTLAGSVLRTISTQFSQPGVISLKSAAVQDTDVSKLTSAMQHEATFQAGARYSQESFLLTKPKKANSRPCAPETH